MGAFDDARRRTGRFLREHQDVVDKATGRLKSAVGGVLARDAAPPRPEQGRAPTSPPPQPPPRSAPPRTPGAAGPSMSRVREQAERLDAGISRVDNETPAEQLVRQNTKAQLMRRAHELEIRGRSRMTKQQLAEEIAARQ